MTELTDKFEKCTTVQDVFVEFMHCIEEWQSGVEGTPKGSDLDELHKIYDIAEVEVKFIVRKEDGQTKKDSQS